MTDKIVVGEFQLTGPNEIDVNLVCKKWNHLWLISEWRSKDSPNWRLVKFVRKDSPMTTLKLTLSAEQAKELIDKLDLTVEQGMFKSGHFWRRESDRIALEEWRREKYKNKSIIY